MININLNTIKYYYLTFNNPKRKKHITEHFNDYDLTEVNPLNPNKHELNKFQSGASGFLKILDLAIQNQNRNEPFQPFIILEDDVKKCDNYPDMITIPDDSDIVYIGLSRASWYKGVQKFNVSRKPINNDIIRVYNMLSTHGMLITSIRGLISFQKCLLEDFFTKRSYDLSITEMQPYLNTYALAKPIVYQYGPLGGYEKDTKIKYDDGLDIEFLKYDVNNISRLTNY
jgi:hypothetical protein